MHKTSSFPSLFHTRTIGRSDNRPLTYANWPFTLHCRRRERVPPGVPELPRVSSRNSTGLPEECHSMLRICCVQHQQHGHHRHRAARGTFDFNWRERAATEAGAGRTASKRNNRQWMAENLEAEIAAAPFVRLVLFPSLLSASGAAGGRREIALLASARSTYGRSSTCSSFGRSNCPSLSSPVTG